MAYDLEEQEQLETLKAWWKQYGTLVVWVLIACLATYIAYTSWMRYQNKQAQEASTLYEEVQKNMLAKDNAKVQASAAKILEKFPKHAYASMASLTAAKSAWDAGDIKGTKENLNWIIDKGNSDDFKSMAKLRMANVLLDEKKLDEGLNILNSTFPLAYEGEVLNLKADYLVAQNKVNEARSAYKAALDKLPTKHPARQFVQIKLDSLGEAGDATVTASASAVSQS